MTQLLVALSSACGGCLIGYVIGRAWASDEAYRRGVLAEQVRWRWSRALEPADPDDEVHWT